MNKICKHCETPHSLRGNECRVCKDGIFRYKMNRVEQLALYESQGRKCHLCSCQIEMFTGATGGFVDHDHQTGAVRSILCNRCNTMVGSVEQLPDINKLLEYLNHSK